MNAKASLGKYGSVGEVTFDAGQFFDYARICFMKNKKTQKAYKDLKHFEWMFYSTFIHWLSIDSVVSPLPNYAYKNRFLSMMRYPVGLEIDTNPDAAKIAMQAIEQFHSEINWLELLHMDVIILDIKLVIERRNWCYFSRTTFPYKFLNL